MRWRGALLSFLNQPLRVFWVCLIAGFLYLLYDGSLWSWWSLRRNYREMENRLTHIENERLDLKEKIKAAKTRDFIERQATEQLGLVRENDLVFVFSDDE